MDGSVLSLLDLRKDPVIIHYPVFNSRFVSLETSAMDHYVIMRVYQPDRKKMKTWKAPKAEKVNP